MHNLQKELRWAEKVLKSLNIPFIHPIEVTVNTRAKSRYGQCRKSADGYHINISEVLMRDSSDIRALDATLLHELIHTCPGCMNHGELWKTYGYRVYEKTGLEIERTSDYEKLYGIRLEKPKEQVESYKYGVYCPKCGHKWFYKRRSKAVLHPELYRCPDCKVTLRSGVLVPAEDEDK